jgi:ABC-2 type transport system permease protein
VTLRAVLAGCRLQYAESRRQPAHLMALATTPLFTAMFLSITLHAGDRRAVVYAVIAPGLINLWFLSLDLGGESVSRERWQGTLELLFATPASLAAVVFGRVLAVAGLAGLTFLEALLVARIGFGVSLEIRHGGLLAAAVAVTLFAMAGTSTAFAGLLVLSREVLLFQNSLTYPFYILGGVLVPLSLLPGWIQPFGRLVFLSWSSDLIRDAIDRPAVPGWPWRLAVIALLGLATLAGGQAVIGRVADRARRTGSVGLA